MNERIEWVDTAKGIGIALMVFGHISLDYGQLWIKQIIAAFHMPLFFLIAGMFIPNHLDFSTALSYVEKKFNTIIVPYILWVLILCDGLSFRNIILMVYGSESSISTMKINGALWFLPCIFIAFCIIAITFVFFDRYQKNNNRLRLHYIIPACAYLAVGGC